MRRIFIVIALLLVGIAFRGTLLAALSGLLVCEQSADSYRYVVILGGDHRFDRAASLVANSLDKSVVVFKYPPSPLVQAGILPPPHEIAIRELESHGTLSGQISIIEVHERNGLWSTAAALDRWLATREGNAVLLTGEFDSRRVRNVIDRVLETHVSNRTFVQALPHRHYNQTNWWQSRLGIKSIVDAIVFLLHTLIMPPPHVEDRVDWYPGELDRRLKSMRPRIQQE